LLVAKEATTQALLELSNKSIPKEEYTEKIMEKTREILRQDTKGFTDREIEQFCTFIEQGKIVPKPSGLSVEENQLIAEAAIRTVRYCEQVLTDNANLMASDDFAKLMATYESDKIINNAIAGFGIDEAHTQKIIDKLSPALSTLGANYLQEHGVAITAELTKALAAGKSLSAKLGMNYTISKDKLNEISSNILNAHQDLAKVIKPAKKLNDKDLDLAKDLIQKSHMSSVDIENRPRNNAMTAKNRPRNNAITNR
jgi:hypothetical protein